MHHNPLPRPHHTPQSAHRLPLFKPGPLQRTAGPQQDRHSQAKPTANSASSTLHHILPTNKILPTHSFLIFCIYLNYICKYYARHPNMHHNPLPSPHHTPQPAHILALFKPNPPPHRYTGPQRATLVPTANSTTHSASISLHHTLTNQNTLPPHYSHIFQILFEIHL